MVKKVRQYRELTRDLLQPLEEYIRSVHPSQGEIRFSLTLRVILQLIQAYFTLVIVKE